MDHDQAATVQPRLSAAEAEAIGRLCAFRPIGPRTRRDRDECEVATRCLGAGCIVIDLAIANAIHVHAQTQTASPNAACVLRAAAVFENLKWTHAPSGFSTGLEVRWADRVFADDLNSAFARSYFVVGWHAGLRQRLASWRLEEFVRVDNLFDESYVGSVIVNAANARYFEPAPERIWLLGFTGSFAP